MPRTSPTQRHEARRALIDDVRDNKPAWLRHGAVAVAVSVLGLSVAGSFTLSGNAQDTSSAQARPVSTTGSVGADAAARDNAMTSRSSSRAPLDPLKAKSFADQRAEELAKADDKIRAAAAGKQVDQREKRLAETSAAAQEQARRLAAGEKVDSRENADDEEAKATAGDGEAKGKACLPAARYRVVATFGQVGSWARYHTGFDFAAPLGTKLRAPASGVVTNAGRGPASGWAGNYVAIKYPDGTQSLMAHMSTVSVQVGQEVSACQTVGAIGVTGRTFGPHVHFEIYPAGITPGDVYRAVNPVTWFKARKLDP